MEKKKPKSKIPPEGLPSKDSDENSTDRFCWVVEKMQWYQNEDLNT